MLHECTLSSLEEKANKRKRKTLVRGRLAEEAIGWSRREEVMSEEAVPANHGAHRGAQLMLVPFPEEGPENTGREKLAE